MEKVENDENTEDTENIEDDELQNALDELANTLDGTIWVGTDADCNIFALAFDGIEIYIGAVDSEGTQTDVEGYWAIGTDTLFVYSDENMTDEIATFYWDFEELDGTNLIYLEDACLAQTSPDEVTDLATAIAQMNTVNNVISYVADGTFWVGSSETEVDFFSFNGSNIIFYAVDMATGEEVEFDGTWGLDYDNFYIVDEESGSYISYTWDIAEDGSIFYLYDEEGNELAFEQTDATDVSEALELVNEYLNQEAE